MELIKTKTFWGGVSLIAYGFTQILLTQDTQGIQAVLEGLAIIFLRDAIKKQWMR